MRRDMKVGATFPDYEFLDHNKIRRKLSQIQGANHLMIVVLSRGLFCPKDQQQHRKLVDFYPELNVAYTKLVTVTTSNWQETVEFRDGLGAQWPFLSDPERIVQKELDIREYTDPRHDPMIPHTIVLEPRLRIFKIYCGYWYWGRPSVEELRSDLREITRRIRPDWDIADPECRKAWRQNRGEFFYPYGK
ncbi:MAG: redoxin domain-containing protein [bacterium]